MSTQPDGAIDGFLTKIFGRSWKTSLSGALTFACGVAVALPGVPQPIKDGCAVALPLLTGAGLIVAKDKGVSGTSR